MIYLHIDGINLTFIKKEINQSINQSNIKKAQLCVSVIRSQWIIRVSQ